MPSNSNSKKQKTSHPTLSMMGHLLQLVLLIMDTSLLVQSKTLFVVTLLKPVISFHEDLDGIAMDYPYNMKLIKSSTLQTRNKSKIWVSNNIMKNADQLLWNIQRKG